MRREAHASLCRGKGRMTAEFAPRRTRKPKVRSSSQDLTIGEIDQTVFACPACARPLALGARRCPGCETRLIMGVQAQRASIFLGVGLAAGLILAAVFATTASAIDRAIHGADVAAVAAGASSARPSASKSPAPTTRPAATAGTGTSSSVPALSRSALAQAASVDERLATSAAALAAALSAPKFDTYGVSQILRATSADAVVGLQLSSHIGAWSGGKALSIELISFHSAIQETAAEGLSASIRNDKAYRAAGQKMLDVLGGLDELDGRLRDVAGKAGVTLAPAVAAP
jgi:hypothetical protein